MINVERRVQLCVLHSTCALPSSSLSITSILALICWCRDSMCSSRFSWHSATDAARGSAAHVRVCARSPPPAWFSVFMLCTSVSAVASPSAAVRAALLLTSSGFISYTDRVTDAFNKQQQRRRRIRFSVNLTNLEIVVVVCSLNNDTLPKMLENSLFWRKCGPPPRPPKNPRSHMKGPCFCYITVLNLQLQYKPWCSELVKHIITLALDSESWRFLLYLKSSKRSADSDQQVDIFQFLSSFI